MSKVQPYGTLYEIFCDAKGMIPVRWKALLKRKD
jgi:hypothetical protein